MELQSAPTGIGSAGALAQTLHEVLQWDWRGAAVVVEHCDAPHPGRPFAKGFLSFAQEIEVVHALRAERLATRCGLSLNWGRSAIDGRSADTPVVQAGLARGRGVLMGVMLSGATATTSEYGPAWSDAHAAVWDPDGLGGEQASLLTPARAADFLATAGPDLVFDGVKVSVRPEDAPARRRLAVVGRALSLLGTQPVGVR